MNCPTCEYELERPDRNRCPRCGTLLDCTVMDCGSCDACGSSVTSLGRRLLDSLTDDE